MLLPGRLAPVAVCLPNSKEVKPAMKKILAIAAFLFLLPVVALAQKPNTKSQTITIKATIDSIDQDERTVTLKDKDGNYETVYCGPEIKRFDELKVGDEITFKYTESVVVKLSKAAEKAKSSTEKPAVVRGAGAKPSATITHQQTAIVTIKAIDQKAPSVTVQTDDGRTSSFKIENKGLLKNVKAGDRVEINYTEALAISVE
jgi:Cu/Ag efflux protein CusF